MFIVQPFRRESSIRSVLGFMSIATRWGDYLFPGITVLTRDLHDIRAMHKVVLQFGGRSSPRQLAEFQKGNAERKIVQTLLDQLKESGVQKKPVDLLQKMSYWQRYGSLFEYFGLLGEKRYRTIQSYRRMIFDPLGLPKGNDERVLRGRRIRHFRWYRDNRHRILRDLTENNISDILKSSKSNWFYWWLTGADAPRNIPRAIKLVREVEFFFSVWQTLFEASGSLLFMKEKVPTVPSRGSQKPQRFVKHILSLRQSYTSEESQELVRVSLALHKSFIKPRLKEWSDSVSEEIGLDGERAKLTTLHTGETVEEFGRREGAELQEALAELHVKYCHMQNKPHAICVHSFKGKLIGHKIPRLSVEYSKTRWGLFGYRFEAALTLDRSEKYL